MAKCDAFLLLVNREKTNTLIQGQPLRNTYTCILSLSLSLSFHHTILLIKKKDTLYGKPYFRKYFNQPQKRKEFSHTNPLLGHKEKVHTTCPLHVLLLIQRKKKPS